MGPRQQQRPTPIWTQALDRRLAQPAVGREIAITLEFPEATPTSIRLFWHQDPDDADFYAEGTALVDGEPVDADLYFTTY